MNNIQVFISFFLHFLDLIHAVWSVDESVAVCVCV